MAKRSIVPFGPQHPVLPEPVHLDLVLEDETVVDVVPSIGFIHRGLEKLVEKRDFKQYVYVAERICGICSCGHGLGYCQACLLYTSWVLAVNPALSLGMKIEYSMENLPYFMEWKSIAAGDYVIGLEPSNSSVYGRGYHVKKGDLHKLPPFGQEKNEIIFSILDGEEEIRKAVSQFQDVFGD